MYQQHVFVCTNQRSDGRKCCADGGAVELRDYAKQRLKELGQHGRGKVRVNASGCLDYCGRGPVLVIYPAGVWYSYETQADIDEIIDTHLLGGEIVERLRLPSATG
ncbi:MAG: (2Fe-2S) ferredoxin domain-containing protein [Gammaproteobacteria bacterium]|nr:(2Fe-2S) ferredoxin domain-containing protein [Gammaproteobacteria bacterium]